MRILVTGGRGFLGTWVAHALRAAGHELRLLLRPGREVSSVQADQVEIVVGDLLDRACVCRALDQVHAVVHMAGMISLRKADRHELERVNVQGTQLLLAAAVERGLRVLHTSSIGTLGFEHQPVVKDERALLQASQVSGFPYLASKVRAERMALDYAARGGDVLVMLPAVLLGPRDRYFSSTRCVQFHLRGLQRFCPTGGIAFADVRDVAQAYCAALERGVRGQRYVLSGFNLSYVELFQQLSLLTGLARASGTPLQVAQLWGLWSELLATYSRHPFDELNLTSATYGAMYNYASSDRAVRELGYRPRPFGDTLRDTIVDHLRRGAARASTSQLQQLLDRAAA